MQKITGNNKEIDRIFTKARKLAWASIKDQSDVIALIREQQLRKQGRLQKQLATQNILNIPK